MMPSHSSGDNKARAAAFALLAVGLASTQDAVVKAMSGTYPVYETMIIRACVALPILGIWLAYTYGIRSLITPLWPRMLVRALILCSAYLAFILSIAAMPMANMVAIYFTMPFFVAGLAGPFLGERVPFYRWIAISAGFVGVIVMVRLAYQHYLARWEFHQWKAVGAKANRRGSDENSEAARKRRLHRMNVAHVITMTR